MENFPTKEQIGEDLKDKVEHAMASALTAEEYKEKEREFVRVLRSMGEPEYDPAEGEAQYKKIKSEMEAGSVFVDTLYEYRKVLELANFSKEQVDHILNHENAHANTADQTLSQTFKGYSVFFSKDKDGMLLVQPFTHLETDPSFSREQIKEDRKKVFEAPKHYGDRLSLDDKTKIDSLHRDILTSYSESNTSVNDYPERRIKHSPKETKKRNLFNTIGDIFSWFFR